MNNEFSKTLKNDIIYLPELPSDNKYIEHTAIAVPAEKEGRFNVYKWFENKWVFIFEINKLDFDLKELKDIYNDLNNAANKLTKISANAENDELFLKLSKITNKVLQAKFELADDVLEPFGKTCNAIRGYKRAEQQQEYFEHQLEEALKDKDNETK
jgi:hypothetical protein